ncbi:hypothetical protein ACFOWB_18035 [Chenggangzhangella methanolivorans]
MKTILTAAAALVISASAAHAASTASERAGGMQAPTAQGERDPRLQQNMTPVMLEREIRGLATPPSPTGTGAVFRGWTGNDNEG